MRLQLRARGSRYTRGVVRAQAPAAGRLPSSQIARTITSLVSYGTLSTISPDGVPLGTFVTFVLDADGCPLVRLRADAAHTANLENSRTCTIFAHPAEQPARRLARVTLVGDMADLSPDEHAEAAERHRRVYASAIGVDAPRDDDTFMRLDVKECFFVGGLGDCDADTISGGEYRSAQPDELREEAAEIVALYRSDANKNNDIRQIAAQLLGKKSDQIMSAEMIWVDVKGVDFQATTQLGDVLTGRLAFQREALDAHDAVSMLTMAAQKAWENEKNYNPVVPELAVNTEVA